LPVNDATIKYISKADGEKLVFNNFIETSNVFNKGKLEEKMQKEILKCSAPSCKNNFKYRIPKTSNIACSLECYKLLTAWCIYIHY